MLDLSNLRRQARQRRFPPEFRISRPAPVPQPRPPAETNEPGPPSLVATSPDLDDDKVAELATKTWRTMRRLAAESEAGDGELTKAARMALRNLRAMSECLTSAGVEVLDHDGRSFDPGLRLKVLAYEPRFGIERETVVDTVSPTVYRAERCIQIGEVIVGTPEKGQNHDA